MNDAPPVLDYATPELGRPPPSIVLFRVAVILSIVAAVGGIACFVGYVASRLDTFVLLGVAWLAVGGAMTAIAFVLGVVYAVQAARARFAGGARLRRALLAVGLPLANVALAATLMIAGTMAIFDGRNNAGPATVVNNAAVNASAASPASQAAAEPGQVDAVAAEPSDADGKPPPSTMPVR